MDPQGDHVGYKQSGIVITVDTLRRKKEVSQQLLNVNLCTLIDLSKHISSTKKEIEYYTYLPSFHF
jgi:hypothetical protein